MKIIRISTRIFPDITGPAKQVYLFSKFCSENNIKTINLACLPKKKNYIKKKKINENYIIHYLPFHAPGRNAGVLKLFVFFVRFVIFGIFEVFKIIRKEKIDLIHAHSPPPSGFVAYFFHKFLRIPYFYSIHGIEVPIQYISDLDINIIAKKSRKTLVVSRSLEKYLIANYKLNNIHWLPNTIESKKYFHVSTKDEKEKIIHNLDLNSILKKEDFIISYIGYMIFKQKVKGMIDFLFGFNQFLKKIQLNGEKNKFKLIFIGDGDYLSTIEDKIIELNLRDNVHLLGRRNDIKEILAISNLLALTSYQEGFPNVILEAMASKVPCLGTNVGEINYIIGNSGYVINPGDINNIERNLEEFFNLSELKKEELMLNAYNRVKSQFDLEKIGNKLIKIYINTLEQ